MINIPTAALIEERPHEAAQCPATLLEALESQLQQAIQRLVQIENAGNLRLHDARVLLQEDEHDLRDEVERDVKDIAKRIAAWTAQEGGR